MENFRKVKKTEEDCPLPFESLPPGVVEMKVKEGSKIRNLMSFAMSRMESEGTMHIVFSGSGRAVTKTITCVEIMKRKLKGLHQITKLRYKTMQEVWENKMQQEGKPDKLTVHKNIPSICILLSKDPLNPAEAGYQPPQTEDCLWKYEELAEDLPVSNKKGLKRPNQNHSEELIYKKSYREDNQIDPKSFNCKLHYSH
ncbi:ribonuclease P protein subunit p25-like protein [Protopterus annectens]|uniref:ribonuclease P protein subunit p25-like protein n=1 Tax=Protopterus annectens TaxID=7888 RepID=UPI001CFB0246|nr:ribonuclease P protein subunit p25-like protein [Protopterus annectens]